MHQVCWHFMGRHNGFANESSTARKTAYSNSSRYQQHGLPVILGRYAIRSGRSVFTLWLQAAPFHRPSVECCRTVASPIIHWRITHRWKRRANYRRWSVNKLNDNKGPVVRPVFCRGKLHFSKESNGLDYWKATNNQTAELDIISFHESTRGDRYLQGRRGVHRWGLNRERLTFYFETTTEEKN